MRTTVTIDPDVEALLKKAMREKGLSFKAAVPQAIRDGLAGKPVRSGRAFRLKTYHMGFRPEVALDQALSLAAAMQDEEIVRKLSLRK